MKLSTEERLDRLEKLIVRVLLSMKARKDGEKCQIDVNGMPRAVRAELEAHYCNFAGHEDAGAAKYAEQAVLDIAGVDIAEEKAKIRASAKRAEANARPISQV